MKKILIVLGILTLICVNCAFADDEIDVFSTLNNANSNTVNSISDYAQIMAHTQSYIRNNNITGFDNTKKFILFPNNVTFSGDRSSITVDFIFQFIDKDAAGTWGVISYPNEGVFDLGTGFYDLVIGYTVNNGVTVYKISCTHNYNSDSYVFTNEYFARPNSVDHSEIWRVTYRELGNTHGLVSDYKTVATWNGIYFSIWSNVDVLPTYYGYYVGYDTGNWDRRYTQNVNFSIPVMRSDSGVNDNATIIISNANGITIPTNEQDVEGLFEFNILNIDKLWEKLKSLIIGLISQIKGVIYLFGSLFSWLPDEIVALVVSGLLFGVIIMIIHFIRGK